MFQVLSTPEYPPHGTHNSIWGLHSLFPRSKLACWESIQGVSAEGRVGLSLDFWPEVSTDLRPPSHHVAWNKVWEVEREDQQARPSIGITTSDPENVGMAL